MTKEELTLMQKRISEFQDLDRHVQNIEGALKHIKDEKLAQLLLDFGEDEIKFRSTDFNEKASMQNVCWAGSEEGIMDEVMQAIVAILEKRKAKYVEQRAAV